MGRVGRTLTCSVSFTGARCSVNCATRRVEVVAGDVLPSVSVAGTTRLDVISIGTSSENRWQWRELASHNNKQCEGVRISSEPFKGLSDRSLVLRRITFHPLSPRTRCLHIGSPLQLGMMVITPSPHRLTVCAMSRPASLSCSLLPLHSSDGTRLEYRDMHDMRATPL